MMNKSMLSTKPIDLNAKNPSQIQAKYDYPKVHIP